MYILSSFDLVSDKSILVKNRKYGQLIISNKFKSFQYLAPKYLALKDEFQVLLKIWVRDTHNSCEGTNGKVEHFDRIKGKISKKFNR